MTAGGCCLFLPFHLHYLLQQVTAELEDAEARIRKSEAVKDEVEVRATLAAYRSILRY